MGLRMWMKQWAACSSSKALRRSESYEQTRAGSTPRAASRGQTHTHHTLQQLQLHTNQPITRLQLPLGGYRTVEEGSP